MASAAAELTPEEAAAAAAAAQAFNIEVWTLLGIGSLVTFLRIVARTRSVGFRKLQPDDYLVIVGLVCLLFRYFRTTKDFPLLQTDVS